MENLNQTEHGPPQRRSEVAAKAICAWPERESFSSVFLLVLLPGLQLCYGDRSKHSSALTAHNRRHNWQAK